MQRMTDAASYGIYVHVPFCTHRCDYCAFATWTDRMHLVDTYVDAVVTDIGRSAGELRPATSVFFGGGTPSLLESGSMAAILGAIRRVGDAEVTVECNPDTVDEPKLRGYHDAGVNRLSFGVQSMVPHVLQSLGRTHDPDNVRRAVDAARTVGFDNLNLDVIYGAAGESVDDWRATVEAVLALEPEHVSAYGLTVEPGTALAADEARHPDDDDQADKYLLASELFAAAGLEWYEISNYARPGRACRHNLLYWRQGDYRGFGCAAHSHVQGRRWWNVRTPERYVGALHDGRSTEAGAEELDEEERRVEGLQLSLRTLDGVPEAALPTAELGHLIERRDGRAHLTVEGRLLANEVSVRLR